MEGYIDIERSFLSAIVSHNDGAQIVTTENFVRELAKNNYTWTLREANEWIENNICPFRDVSLLEGELRIFQLSKSCGEK